jgi:hypothetical protein
MPGSDETIVLGEFWVDSDGEVFIDPTGPMPGLQNAVKLQKIKELQQKLQQANDQQSPPITPHLQSNRTREAQGKSKGY